jgi:hypothetical protein
VANVSREPANIDAYEAFDRGMELYIRQESREALSHFYRAYQLDSMWVTPLLYAAVNHGNLGESAQVDSVLDLVESLDETLPEYDRTWRPTFTQLERQDLTFTDLRTVVLASDIVCTIRAVTGIATDTTGTTRPKISSIETLVWVKRNGEWRALIGHESLQKKSWQGWLDFEVSQ